MKQKSFADMRCSIARSLEIIGPWWSFLILRDAFMGVRRFKDFERSLGIAKNTLSNRLKLLVENDLLEKTSATDGTKYEEYHLTQKGRELFPVLVAITQWGDKWAVHENGPSFEIIDTRTKSAIPPLALLGSDGQPLPEEFIGVKRA